MFLQFVVCWSLMTDNGRFIGVKLTLAEQYDVLLFIPKLRRFINTSCLWSNTSKCCILILPCGTWTSCIINHELHSSWINNNLVSPANATKKLRNFLLPKDKLKFLAFGSAKRVCDNTFGATRRQWQWFGITFEEFLSWLFFNKDYEFYALCKHIQLAERKGQRQSTLQSPKSKAKSKSSQVEFGTSPRHKRVPFVLSVPPKTWSKKVWLPKLNLNLRQNSQVTSKYFKKCYCGVGMIEYNIFIFFVQCSELLYYYISSIKCGQGQ